MMPMQNPFPTGGAGVGSGLLGALGGFGNYKVVQKPDGSYVVIEISVEDIKREIQSKIDPRLAPFVNVTANSRGIIVEVKI